MGVHAAGGRRAVAVLPRADVLAVRRARTAESAFDPTLGLRRLRGSGRSPHSIRIGSSAAVDLRRLVRRPGGAPIRGDASRTRSRALVLASTPGPGWHLRPRHELYARGPVALRTAVHRGSRRCGCDRNSRRAARRGAHGGASRDRSLRHASVGAGLAHADGATRAAHRHARRRDRLRTDHRADARRHRRAAGSITSCGRRLLALRAADRRTPAHVVLERTGPSGHDHAAGRVRGRRIRRVAIGLRSLRLQAQGARCR